MATSDPFSQLKAALDTAARVLTAQGAFGWMYRGDIERARQLLVKMSPEARLEVSLAAAALSALADEVSAASD